MYINPKNSRGCDEQLQKVRMIINNPSSEGKIIMLVEGDDDKKVFGALVLSSSIVIVVLGGCSCFRRILEDLNKTYLDRVIAIKDADFDRYNKVDYNDVPNLFLTDGHDLEMTILNDSFKRQILIEFMEEETEKFFDCIFNDLKHLTYVRWFNSASDLGLDFRALRVSKSIYDGIHQITIDKCAERLSAINSLSDKFIEQVAMFESDYEGANWNQITNGHDFCQALAIKIQTCSNKKTNVNEELIVRLLRMSYDLHKFKGTMLYNLVKKWGEHNGFSVWRSE